MRTQSADDLIKDLQRICIEKTEILQQLKEVRRIEKTKCTDKDVEKTGGNNAEIKSLNPGHRVVITDHTRQHKVKNPER